MARIALWVLATIAACLGLAQADRLTSKMYTQLNGNIMCSRLLNSEGEIGCTSGSNGESGVLYMIRNDTEFNNFKANSKSQTVPLVSAAMFGRADVVQTLLDSSDCVGIMVFDDVTDPAWSADNKMPNYQNGLPYGYSGLPSSTWNTVGGGYNRNLNNASEGLMFMDMDKPIFYATSADMVKINACYNSYNLGADPSYPLCGVQLTSWMWGAKDAQTCLRRGYCDPLANQNVWGTLRPLNSTEEVVMIAAQMDSAAFFRDLSYGAEADMSGAAALLFAAEILGRPANNVSRIQGRNIMFSLFHGEAFGYIGSSKMGYDIKKGVFPTSDAPLSFNRISHYLELNQLMSGTNEFRVFAHNSTAPQVGNIATLLTNAAVGGLSFVSGAADLPPVSLRSLLHEMHSDSAMSQFNGVAITGFNTSGFTNSFYHTRADNSKNFNTGNLTVSANVQRICNVALTIAKTAFALAANSGITPLPDETIDCTKVAELMYCITTNKSCDLAVSLVGSIGTGAMNRYIGTQSSTSTDTGTGFLLATLAKNLATDVVNGTTSSNCQYENSPPSAQSYFLRDGRCLTTTTFTHRAISPAFDGYSLRSDRDPRHSTWTEARWDNSVAARLFLMSSPEEQRAILGGGIAVMCFSVIIVVVFNKFVFSNLLDQHGLHLPIRDTE